jgi:hypothetical protein
MTTATASERTDLPGNSGAGYVPPDEYRPIGGYAALAAAFGTAFAGSLAIARSSGHELPERVSAGDIALAGIATHKVSRLLTKDKVTSPVRAPFTRFQKASGHGEVEEAARGRGLRYATGELLTCPYCIGQWVAGAFFVGYVAAPRLTRLLAAMWTAHALADAAQLAYSAAEKRS